MNKEREDIEKQISEMSIEDILKDKPKMSKKEAFKRTIKEIIKDTLLFPITFIGGLLGVTKENIDASRDSVGGGAGNSENNYVSSNSGGSTFRDSVSFDPSKAYMERIQEKAYFQMVDGKGDPEHCDCDHDR